MTFSRLATSLVALALFAGPAFAQEQSQPAEDAPAVETTKAILPPAVKTLLADQRPLDQLSDKELGQRLRQARKFAALEGLSDDVRGALREMAAGAESELAQRQTVAQGEPAGSSDAGQKPEDAPADTVAPIATQVPDDALAFIADERTADALSRDELQARIAEGRRLMAIKGLPKRVQRQIAQKVEADRAILRSAAKPSGETATDSANTQDSGVDGGAAGTEEPGMTAGAVTGGQSGVTVGGEIQGQPDASTGTPAVKMKPKPSADDGRALDLINETVAAETMRLAALQQRVREMRRLIRVGQLSPPVREALYQRLVRERTILRQRVALQNGGVTNYPEEGGGSAGGDVTVSPGGNNGGFTNYPDEEGGSHGDGTVTNYPDEEGGTTGAFLDNRYRKWVQDRRPPRDLRDDELRLRINIFVNIVNDNRYSGLDRANWNERLRYDRQELRERMLRERALREARLRKANERIVLDQMPAPEDDFDLAEADRRELEDALVSKPRRQAERRYSIEDFERRPELRDAVPRIEIDTIRFGFNESFIREEEIGKLDKVAEIIERILIANPDEVFLIEGHTDASGSDSYNLGLSRQRAAAVKQALVTYYVIPARSIQTVGYGERYLKIPVPGPEAENRRVSVSRITDFLARY